MEKQEISQLTIAEVARLAGVARATIYKRAKSKGVDLSQELNPDILMALGVPSDIVMGDTVVNELNDKVTELETTIEQLETEKRQLQERADNDHKALLQEQSLHLMTQQRLEQSMASVALLETKAQEQEQEKESKEEPKKKWWQIFK